MKAISKSYGNFEVRFSTPSMFNLKRLSTYDSFENSGLVNAEINFKRKTFHFHAIMDKMN